jgi:hypothetical protein
LLPALGSENSTADEDESHPGSGSDDTLGQQIASNEPEAMNLESTTITNNEREIPIEQLS